MPVRSLPVKPWHIPARLASGIVILNSGLSKRDPDEQTAAALHGMAAGTYPFLRRIPPRRFVRLLAASEIALGAALLAPVVPTALAGVGLTAFSAALLGLYLRTPGMRQPGSLRPTQQGTPLIKDLWLLGIGLGFIVEDVVVEDVVVEDVTRDELGRDQHRPE
ncbi:hypothetical protein HC030_21580 [Planosporangium mesophilum]|nr:hypothetical protein [Planosporangium mesophilum]NJC85127.1 hypothetical protein [Planosporangium mesophilum]